MSHRYPHKIEVSSTGEKNCTQCGASAFQEKEGCPFASAAMVAAEAENQKAGAARLKVFVDWFGILMTTIIAVSMILYFLIKIADLTRAVESISNEIQMAGRACGRGGLFGLMSFFRGKFQSENGIDIPF